MSKNNKSFVIAMMVTAVVGLVVLMTMMFMGLKYVVEQNNQVITSGESNVELKEENMDVEYSTTVLAVVTDVNASEISVIDIESSQTVVKSIDHVTKVADAYNKTIPLSSIKKGDIVELVYEADRGRTLAINKSADAWSKKSVNGAKVNDVAHEVELFGSIYTYGEDTVVVDHEDMPIAMEAVKPCDIVTVQGIKDSVLSIRVEKPAGSINITDIPKDEGHIEIDINTMLPLTQITGPIEVVAGKHKVAINIKGYENMIQEIEVAPGEVYEMSLNDIARAYTNVKVAISNVDVENYNIKIGNTTYAKGDEISLPQGIYTATITAENYKLWTKTITLDKPNCTIKVTLQSDKVEETTTPSTSTPSKEEANNTEATKGTKTIDIASDPSGAKVYINGVNKGTTPYKATLPMGSYSILLEKEGYEVYSTSIILDGSDDQTGFLYVLTPNS